MGLTDRTVFQNAWVVDDLTKAMNHWINFYGVGPFYLLEHLTLGALEYRGKPTELDISVGIAQAGPVQIELIQQFSDGPSVYRDQVPKGKSGFHHVCIYSHDFEADRQYFEAHDYPTVFRGGADGSVQFAYYDTRKDFDVFTEVVTAHRRFIARNDAIRQAAESWDGVDPIRVFHEDGYRVP